MSIKNKVDSQTVLKNYRKKPFSELDPLYITTLVLSFLLHYGIVGYFVLNPPESRLPIKGTVERIQAGYADQLLGGETTVMANQLKIDQQLYEYEAPAEEETSANLLQEPETQYAQEEEPDSDEPTPRADGGVEDKAVERQRTLSDRSDASARSFGRTGSSSRRDAQMADKGILGALTRSGSQGGEKAIDDILNSDEELDDIYKEIGKGSAAGQGKAAGSGGRGEGGGTSDSGGRKEVQGQRRTVTGSINTRISDIEGTGSGEGSGAGGAEATKNTKMIKTELTPIQSEDDTDANERQTLVGARDLNTVSEVVFSHNSAIQYCFERELLSNPDLRGKIVIRFTITPAGNVKDPEILSSTLNSKHVERCILSRVSLWNDFGAIDPELGNAVFRQVYTFGY
ncbi:AgmX/PglI C-terminal domain-containing protein [candidate division KSB1 bacterium]|nr:AgmX/PglI C-terminal domain-containing protein [candidate division KSB1 bacterium]